MQARINGLERQLELVTAERNRLQAEHAAPSAVQDDHSEAAPLSSRRHASTQWTCRAASTAKVAELMHQLQISQDYHQEELIALQQRHAQALSALHAQHEAALEVRCRQHTQPTCLNHRGWRI